jgi:hypothetical protein
MFDLASPQNSVEKVEFREKILTVQNGIQKMIKDGVAPDALPDCTLTHYFVPKDKKYGCCTYARQMFIPKGTVIVGKIHRHQHLNFILQGKVSVATEFGKKYFEAPCVFISEVGLKRAVVAEDDTLWVTVHLVEHEGEEHLDKIEDEVIAPNYAELGFVDSVDGLKRLEGEAK